MDNKLENKFNMKKEYMNHSFFNEIKIRKIKQVFCQDKIPNVSEYIHQEFNNSDLKCHIKPGNRIGITVGSRGISEIHNIIKQIIIELKNNQVKPFILTAMGSHGGASSQGQRKILNSYGITEEKMGVEILSSMKTIHIGTIKDKIPIYFSQEALRLDGIIALNRIKLHTDFKSNILESGISKMLVIGLGKRNGAESIHSLGVNGLKNIIPQAAKLIIKKASIIQGIGILENGYDQIMKIKFCTPEEIIATDTQLLKKCKEIFPSLPCNKIDIAISQEMGKNISGTGLDTNVIGRLEINGEKEICKPNISKLVVFDITSQSHGNALGVGLSDIITRKLFNRINFKNTYANTITSTFLKRAKIPVIADTEKEAVEIALKTCWELHRNNLRLLIMKNTLDLEYLFVSKMIWDDIKNRKNIVAIGDWQNLSFEKNGKMLRRL